MSATLIRGGTVIDGTGAPPSAADVVLRGGYVATVCEPGAASQHSGDVDEVIDAAGLAVLPGFLDMHTHSDVSLYLDGRGQSKVFQGVTTEVIGNCGFSAFPLVTERRAEQLELLAGIGDPAIDPSWSDLDGYAQALESNGIAVNVVPLVGHGQLRLAAMGADDRSATPEELSWMTAELDRLLGQGAFGMSTGLTYVPSRFAPTEELIALCRVLAARGRLYATHARGTGLDAVREAVSLAHASGVRVQYSHLAINEPDRWGRAAELLSLMRDARAEGADLTADVYPYHASSSALTQYLPAWVTAGGVAAMRSRLADGNVFARAEDELAAGWGNGGRIPWFWDRVVLSRGDGLLGVRDGDTIEQAAERAGATPAGLVLALCRAGGNRVQVVLYYRTEEDMRTFLSDTHSMVGSDGAALGYDLTDRRTHPRAYGTHARVMGRYVREEGVVDVADAVHRMSGAVAARLGLPDRGVLRPGAAGDLVIMDLATVIDCATFLDPAQPPQGIAAVYVNGEVVVRDGRQTSARPGRVLRAA